MDAEGRRQACLGHHTAVPLPSLDPLSVLPTCPWHTSAGISGSDRCAALGKRAEQVNGHDASSWRQREGLRVPHPPHQDKLREGCSLGPPCSVCRPRLIPGERGQRFPGSGHKGIKPPSSGVPDTALGRANSLGPSTPQHVGVGPVGGSLQGGKWDRLRARCASRREQKCPQ